MFNSYYEIEQDGRKYFGNVSLKEFHNFRQEGENYLFNVATMMPYPLSESVARLVDKVASSFGGGLFSEQSMEVLKKLDLVAGIERQPASPVREPAVGEAELKPADGAASRHAVSSIALFVAQECNMACVYCYGQGGEYADKGMMNAETAFKAVDWLMKNSGDIESVNISFFGGEPMMNFPLIKKVVKYAKQAAQKQGKKITFGMTTNASLLSDQRIAYLKEENIHPLISFDGSAEIQNRQRPFTNGKGSYDKTYANIQKLQKVFPIVMARATQYGDTDPAEIRAGLEQAGFKSFMIEKASRVILDNPLAEGEQPSEQADERTIAMEKSLALDLLRDIKARKVGKEAANSMVGFFVGQMISTEKRHYFCGVGRGMAAITISGDIYPCHRFAGQEDMKLGNIDSYKVDGINDYHRAVVENLPECKTCWARHACGGGCFYESKAARGDIHLPDRSHCAEIKALMEMAIPLYLQLDDADKVYVKDSLKRELEDQIP
jgi:uncharacterized protein